MKIKWLKSGVVVVCDGLLHVYNGEGVIHNTTCWCHMASEDQLKQWEVLDNVKTI